jgi:hypothetical protein
LAFRELRKLGYFARQKFWCCQTCAWAEVPTEKAGKAVFYHAQDDADRRAGRGFHLSWAGDGAEIVAVLKKHGIATKWGGSPERLIFVLPDFTTWLALIRSWGNRSRLAATSRTTRGAPAWNPRHTPWRFSEVIELSGIEAGDE